LSAQTWCTRHQCSAAACKPLVFEQVVNRAICTAPTVKDAVMAFVGLQHIGLERETDVYNCLLHRVAKDSQWDQVLQSFRQMLDAAVPTNSETYSALLGACIKGFPLYTCSLKSFGVGCTIHRGNSAIQIPQAYCQCPQSVSLIHRHKSAVYTREEVTCTLKCTAEATFCFCTCRQQGVRRVPDIRVDGCGMR
jgi:hypothetical protein